LDLFFRRERKFRAQCASVALNRLWCERTVAMVGINRLSVSTALVPMLGLHPEMVPCAVANRSAR